MEAKELKEVVEAAVKETLISIGINAEDAIELQKDHSFVRELRKTHEAVKRKSLLALVGVVVMGVFTFIVFLIREWLNV
jgi:hypothetical protein